jgi:hypothetical protein
MDSSVLCFDPHFATEKSGDIDPKMPGFAPESVDFRRAGYDVHCYLDFDHI